MSRITDANDAMNAQLDPVELVARAPVVQAPEEPEEEAASDVPPMPEAPPPEAYDDEDTDEPEESLPHVKYTLRLDRAVAHARRLLGQQDDIFVYTDGLVHIVDDPQTPGAQRPAAFETYGLMARMAGCMTFVRWEEAKEQWLPRSVPIDVARSLLGLRDWSDVRHLVGITRTPLLRPDGSILQEPGYDEASGLLYRPTRDYPRVPDEPTKRQVDKAVKDLLNVVVDFPFKSAADKSAWLALILTLVARYCIDGPTPFFAGIANRAGTGKTINLASACAIATGEWPTLNEAPDTNDEMAKRILSTVRDAARVEFFDNISADRPLGWASFDKVLTSQRLRQRILGQSKNIEADVWTVFVGTINNATLAADMHRRILPIRLETDLERPEDRAGFKHKNLKRYVMRHQPRLLVAALTLLRAYEVAGRPSQDLPAWGSYEALTDVVRAPLVWAGLADPILTREGIRGFDLDAMARQRVLKALWERYAGGRFRTRDITTVLRQGGQQAADIRDALEEVFGDAPPSPRRIGRLLAGMRDAWMDGMALRCSNDPATNALVFHIERRFRASEETRRQVQPNESQNREAAS